MRRLGVALCLLAWAAAAGAADCNLNGVEDATDIGAGAADCNANGVPDTCELFPVAFTASRLPAGSLPAAVATGELTGDTLPDLAIANPDAGTLTIFEGAPGGTFTSPDTVNVGMRPEAVVAYFRSAMLIGFGSTTDLIVANGDSNTVSVLANAGDGTFSNISGSPFAVPGHPNGLGVGDLTGDGDPDIVVSRRDAGGVSVFASNGLGGYTTSGIVVPTGAQPRAVVLADIDRDGFIDALVANRGSGTVSFLKNNVGTNFIVPAVTVATVGDPVAIAVADLDADGDLDLAVLSGTDNAVHLFLNDGAATFSPGATIPAAAQGAALQLVDLDANGAVDIVAITTAGDAAVIALNDGTGVFGAPTAVAVGDGPLDVVPLDIDLDGRTDLVVTNSLSADVSVLLGTGPVVRDCDATGVLDVCEPARLDCNANGIADTCDTASPIAFGAPVYTPVADTSVPLAVGDLDGDGRADVVWRRTGPKLVVGRGMSDGRLTELGAFDLPDNPTRLLLADVEGDGDRDVVVTSNAGRTVHVLRNDGAGSLAAPETYALTNQPNAVVAGEFTGDGVLDLVVSHSDVSSLLVLAGTGGGVFTPGASVALTGGAVDLVTGDVDGDGDTDIVAFVAVAGGNTEVAVIRNDAGTLAVQAPVLTQVPPSRLVGIAGADLDGDGDLDLALLVVDLATGSIRLRLAPSTGGTYTFGQVLPFAQVAGGLRFGVFAATSAIADFDRDGHLDLAFPGFLGTMASVFRNHGDGTLEPARPASVGRRIFGIAAGDVTGDGAPDLVAGTIASQMTLAVVPGLAFSPVDVNANGVPDCREEIRCGDCADDDGDGLFDVADPDCAGAALTLRNVAVRPARGRRPARAKLVAEVPAALALDPASTAFGVTVGAAKTYCGTPGLRRKGSHAFRLGAADGTLTGLVLQTVRRNRGLRARAELGPLAPSPSAGDVVRVWIVGGGQAFRGQATLRKKGKTLIGP